MNGHSTHYHERIRIYFYLWYIFRVMADLDKKWNILIEIDFWKFSYIKNWPKIDLYIAKDHCRIGNQQNYDKQCIIRPIKKNHVRNFQWLDMPLPKKSMNELLLTTTSTPLEAFLVASCRGSYVVLPFCFSLSSSLLSGAMCHVRATPPGRAKSFQFDMAVAAWWRIDDSIENRHIFNSWIIINALMLS